MDNKMHELGRAYWLDYIHIMTQLGLLHHSEDMTNVSEIEVKISKQIER